MKNFLLWPAVAAVAAATIITTTTPGDTTHTTVAQHRSWGYQGNGGNQLPPPPPPPTETQIITIGRVNIHSGGRLHGSANKRVGCGGCPGHPAATPIPTLPDLYWILPIR